MEKIDYKTLNARQKEDYNFHKVAAALADYGFNCLRLNDDWEGSDFIAIHVKGNMRKFQLKGRFTVAKKYKGKEIWIAFIENGDIKVYKHDEALNLLLPKVEASESWKGDGVYSWPKTPRDFDELMKCL